MKVAVVNMVGNIGKSTVAGHLLMPRMKGSPRLFSIESINTGAEADGIDVEKLAGKQFGELTDEMMRLDDAIVDVGITNAEDFFKKLQQYSGAHEDFDYFVIPTIPKDEKVMKHTVKTVQLLKAIGVDRKRIRIIFNRVEPEDDIEREFAPIFGLEAMEKNCTVNPSAIIYNNEAFQRIKGTGVSLRAVADDPIDYRAKLKVAATEDEKDHCIEMIQLKRLAVTANKNLDDAFAAVFK